MRHLSGGEVGAWLAVLGLMATLAAVNVILLRRDRS